MKNFLKKYIRPTVRALGLYAFLHRAFFRMLDQKTRLSNHLKKFTRKTAPILLYHRVAAVSSDPISLCVSPECFEEHLRFLKEHYRILPLSELSRRLTSGTLIGNETAITFDDGYRDNLTNVLPLLEKYNVPATIFITTNWLGEQASTEWDLKYAPNDRAWFLSKDEIKTLAAHPLIELGAHTASHPRLSDLTYDEQKLDIALGLDALKEITGNKIKNFAYPFGGNYDFDRRSVAAVRALGFDFAFTNTQALATAARNPYRLPRINIRDCSTATLAAQLLTPKEGLPDH